MVRMEKVMCIEKVKHVNGKQVTMYYTLQFESGRKGVYTAKQVKELVASGRFGLLNLQIDKAGRLVKKAVTREEVNKSDGFYMLKPTGYKNVDFYNKMRAEQGQKIMLADDFLKSRKEVFKEIKDKTLAEVIVCRAANSYKFPTSYLGSLDEDEIVKEADLVGEIKSLAQQFGIDPVKLAKKLLNWNEDLEARHLVDAEIYHEPYIRDEDGNILYKFTDYNVMYWSYWIKIAPKVWLCWY